MNYNGMLTVVGGALSRWVQRDHERDAARAAIAATLAMLPQSDEAVAIIADAIGGDEFVGRTRSEDARAALYALAEWAQDPSDRSRRQSQGTATESSPSPNT